MIKNILVILHLIIIFVLTFYELIIINKHNFDYLYCLSIYLIILHWTLLNGECIISYLYKSIDDENYTIAKNLVNDDLSLIFGKYKLITLLIMQVFVFGNLYLICKRKNINFKYYYIFIVLYVSYEYILFKNIKNTHEPNYSLYNKIFSLLFFIFGIYFLVNHEYLCSII